MEKDPRLPLITSKAQGQSGLQETLSQRTNKRTKQKQQKNKPNGSFKSRHILPNGYQAWISGDHFIAPALGIEAQASMRATQTTASDQKSVKATRREREWTGTKCPLCSWPNSKVRSVGQRKRGQTSLPGARLAIKRTSVQLLNQSPKYTG